MIHRGELVLSRSTPRKKKVSQLTFQGPNKVKHEHFLRAVELSKKCKPELSKKGKPFPRVGVVVVRKGKIISESFRGEIGRGEHAEYIALEKKAGGNPNIQGADLITTLEPCTTRSHGKRPCVTWIKTRNIRKVWIATLDYNPVIAGLGELALQKEEILIGRFPDDLIPIVLRDNKEFFDMIQQKQPQITTGEQKKERRVIIENLKESLQIEYQQRELIAQKYLAPGQSKSGYHELKRALAVVDSRISQLLDALNYAIAVDMNTVGSWVHLGDALLISRRFGSALLAYRIATEIDATNKWAWEGLVQTESNLSKSDSYWPRYYTVKEIDSSPSSIHSNTWMKFARLENDWSMKIRMVTRAIQNGGGIDSIWQFIEEMGQQSIKLHHEVELNWSKMSRRDQSQQREKAEKEGEAWFILVEVLDSSGEKAKSKECNKIWKVTRGIED